MTSEKQVNFTYLDSDGLYKDLHISTEVYRTTESWQQNPASLPAHPAEDEGEQLILRRCFDATASWADQFRAPETDRAKDRDSLYLDVYAADAVVSQAETDLSDITREAHESREELESMLKQEKDNLLNLKQYYGLSRDPVYQPKKRATYILTVAVGCCETAIGTTSLAAVSAGGILGGASLSLIMSALNLGLGMALGVYAPRLYEPRRNPFGKRLAGIGLVILALAAVVAANLMFGNVRHYGLNNFSTSLSVFWQGGILPQSLEAFGLVTFGVMIFGGTFLKYSRLHDPVPEYEQADRQVERIEEELTQIDSEVRPALRRIVAMANEQLSNFANHAREACIACRHSLRDTESAFSSYIAGRERIVKIHEQCAEKRRSALRYACQRVPEYWKQSPINFSIIVSDDWDLSPAREQLEKVEKSADELLKNVAKKREELEHDYRLTLENYGGLSDDEDRPIAEAAE